MSSDADRNPSPPPELMVEHEHYVNFVPDKIGDSAYSKQGLLQILVDIVDSVRVLDPENSKNPPKEEEAALDVDNYTVAELDTTIEEKACSLWDMSASRAVATFLMEFSASKIFFDVIKRTRCPRLVEILVGILANMVSFKEILEDLTNNSSFIDEFLLLSSSFDIPTCVQAFRLMHTALLNQTTKQLWIKALMEPDSSGYMYSDIIQRILNNSLNGESLKGALKLVYYLFDEDEEICDACMKENYTRALINAGNQLMTLEDHEGLDEFWLVLNILFQYKQNVEDFAQHYQELSRVYHSYIMRFGDNEEVLPEPDGVPGLAACFNTYRALLVSNSMTSELAKEEFFLLGLLHKMYVSTEEAIAKVNKRDGEEHANESSESPKAEDRVLQPMSDSTNGKDEQTGDDVRERQRENLIILKNEMQNVALALSSYADTDDDNGKLLLSLISNK